MDAFPVVYARDVGAMCSFYESLGFVRRYQFPPEGEPGYVSLVRGDSKLGVASSDSPVELAGLRVGTGPRFELFVYVEDVDHGVERLRPAGVPVLMEPADMPWGERIAYIADPEGNPVVLAAPVR